ncbi:MAG TPA: hypothetical protein VF109_09055 [Mycobacteriales bacterium]
MLTAIGFCPQPPLLVPELAAGAAGELDALRAACAEVIRRLLGAGPDRVVVLGTGPRTRTYAPGTGGSLAGFGVPVTAALPGVPVTAALPGAPARGHRGLPLPLTVGAWLLAGAAVPCTGVELGPDADLRALAACLDGGRAALLVMGDGSARRCEGAPGYVDPRAAPHDAAVAAALRGGDAAALRELDPALGAELLAAGVPVWRAAGHVAGDDELAADLLYDDAPYGVGYLAATWLPA